MASMTTRARAELAPHGRLRAALNNSNFLLVSAREPEFVGVAPDLARELARRAGATLECVGFANAGLVADAVDEANGWDVAFIGAEPERAARITFTPAYVEIDATYLVPASSPFQTLDEIDRPGIRIASAQRAAYTLYLQRTLRHAVVVEAASIPDSFHLFVRDGLDVLAGLRPRLLDDAAQLPGASVLTGRFTTIQQAIATPRGREAAATYLEAFVDDIKTSGWLADLIARHAVRGLSIAPAMHDRADGASSPPPR